MHNGVRVHEFGLRRSDKRLRGSDNAVHSSFYIISTALLFVVVVA